MPDAPQTLGPVSFADLAAAAERFHKEDPDGHFIVDFGPLAVPQLAECIRELLADRERLDAWKRCGQRNAEILAHVAAERDELKTEAAQLRGHVTTLTKTAREFEQDAKRYRLIRDHKAEGVAVKGPDGPRWWQVLGSPWPSLYAPTFDDAVDQAIEEVEAAVAERS